MRPALRAVEGRGPGGAVENKYVPVPGIPPLLAGIELAVVHPHPLYVFLRAVETERHGVSDPGSPGVLGIDDPETAEGGRRHGEAGTEVLHAQLHGNPHGQVIELGFGHQPTGGTDAGESRGRRRTGIRPERAEVQ